MGICTQTPGAHHDQAIPWQPCIRYTLAYVTTLNAIILLVNVIILPFKSASHSHLVGWFGNLTSLLGLFLSIQRDISCPLALTEQVISVPGQACLNKLRKMLKPLKCKQPI